MRNNYDRLTKSLKDIKINKIYVSKVGWIQLDEETKEELYITTKDINLYDLLNYFKNDDPKSFEPLLAFEICGKNENGKMEYKTFRL